MIGRPSRVLVADDNPVDVSLIKAQLAGAGFDVTGVASGAEALEIVREAAPDVILLDALMGGLDGYEICRRIKADPATEGIPVVMITALHETSDKIRALEVGASDFLTKPVDRAELLARVRTLLQVKKLNDRLAASDAGQRALVDELTQSVERLKGLGEISRAITSNLNLDEALASIVTRAVQLSGADDGSIREYDPATQTLPYRASYGLSEEAINEARSRDGDPRLHDWGNLGQAVRTRQIFQIGDVEALTPAELGPDQELALARRLERWRRRGIRTLLVVPLIGQDMTGVLVMHRKTPGEFSAETIDLLQAFAAHSAIAIQNARLFERLQQESTAIERERQTLSAIMAGMSDGLIVVDPAVCIRYCNAKASELLSADSSTMVGCRIEDLLSSSKTLAEPAAAIGRLKSALARVSERPAFELTLSGPPRRDLLALVFPVTGIPSEGLDSGVLLHDVTHERDLARTKDELVSVVSHELRTPLASLVGFAELLLKRDYNEAQRREFLTVMYEEGRRLTGLISDFLDLQRMESGRQTVNLRPLQIGPVLERAVASAGEDEMRPIVVDVADDLPLVEADPDHLHQVLVNLLSNARKYSPMGGEIRLAAELSRRGGLKVTVEDHGLGLPPEALPRLFQKFYRVDNSDRRSIAGTGLGLAICRQIIAEHGGRIRAQSAGLGHGSRFYFTLPVTKPHPTGGDVLIVEDDPGFARLLEVELAPLGLSAVRVASAEAALQQIAMALPRAIALDLILPGLSGEELLERLASNGGVPVPVVVATVKDLTAEAQQRLASRGVIAILPKGAEAAAAVAKALAAACLGRRLTDRTPRPAASEIRAETV